MSLLQQALRDGRMSEIETTLAVKVKRHPKYNNLVMFKYDMINSPMANPIVQECRGAILDQTNGWEYVARPFDKFFNYGEGHAADIDWATARVQEKLDGSLMIMYHFDGAWHIASSGTPDACGQVNDLDMTFGDLFWKTWKTHGYELPDDSYKNHTFMFELMTPFNRVVVPHKESKIALIGVRNRVTGFDMDVGSFFGMDWPIVKEFPLQTMDQVIATFDKFDGIEQEGYVVVDSFGKRVKVKHPGYVAIHHLKGDDGPSNKKMLQIVRSGESSEVLTYFPEWTPIYNDIQVKYNALLLQLNGDFNKSMNATNAFGVSFLNGGGTSLSPALIQKEFASHAVKSVCPDALFKMRARKIQTMEEYLSGIPLDRCMDILGKV